MEISFNTCYIQELGNFIAEDLYNKIDEYKLLSPKEQGIFIGDILDNYFALYSLSTTDE